jgi:osmotically inducible lipoprotein OsmB
MPKRSFLKPLLVALAALLSLSACLETDAERGLVGAAGGAVAADALGVNPVTGALAGGALGYFCDELNVPGCKKRP